MNKRLDNIVCFRMSDEELKELQEKCDEIGVSRGNFIRHAIKNSAINRIDGLPEITIQLLRVGNNINQIARVLNSNPNSSVVNNLITVKAEIGEIKEQIIRIGDKVCQ